MTGSAQKQMIKWCSLVTYHLQCCTTRGAKGGHMRNILNKFDKHCSSSGSASAMAAPSAALSSAIDSALAQPAEREKVERDETVVAISRAFRRQRKPSTVDVKLWLTVVLAGATAFGLFVLDAVGLAPS